MQDVITIASKQYDRLINQTRILANKPDEYARISNIIHALTRFYNTLRCPLPLNSLELSPMHMTCNIHQCYPCSRYFVSKAGSFPVNYKAASSDPGKADNPAP